MAVCAAFALVPACQRVLSSPESLPAGPSLLPVVGDPRRTDRRASTARAAPCRPAEAGRHSQLLPAPALAQVVRHLGPQLRHNHANTTTILRY